jgi:hypothetical protein
MSYMLLCFQLRRSHHAGDVTYPRATLPVASNGSNATCECGCFLAYCLSATLPARLPQEVVTFSGPAFLYVSHLPTHSCIVALDRSFECPACKQAEKQEEKGEGQHGAVYVRAPDGRCISVFPHLQDTFTVLKVTFNVSIFTVE